MSKYKVAALIVNYNMPERADALAGHIKLFSKYPVDVYLIDNGSDLTEPAEHTNIWVKKNIQTTRGWLTGLQEIDYLGNDYFAYWFLITSASFISQMDILAPMVYFLKNTPNAVGIHPALTENSTTVWDQHYSRGTGAPRQTHHIDNIASLYRADWFDQIGRFDEQLTYAHGVDLETCYKARKQGKTLWVDDRFLIEKISNIGYTMDRMNMTAEQRRANAQAEMDRVFIPRYGANYWHFLQNELVTEEMR